jgi:hypothetical protein
VAKKSKPTKQKHRTLIIILAAAVFCSVAVIGWAVYDARPPKPKVYPPPNHTIPYVDGATATQQVANFYQQYMNPNTPLALRLKLIEAFGNKNLLFYSEYYRHGFDPITCSAAMPTKVNASLVSTGPVAIVNADLEYPDNTKATIVAKVVLDDEGVSIDSITCPGNKGNLQPERTLQN